MLIVDAHLDLAWNAIDWNRNLLLPVSEIRAAEQEERHVYKALARNTVSFPALREGGIGLFIATLLARTFRPNRMPPISRYTTMEAAAAVGEGQMAYYRAMEEAGVLRWIRDRSALTKHVEAWRSGVADGEPLGFILSMEGADPVLSPKHVERWFEAGLRIIGPAHYGVSPYAHGTATLGGLFPEGKPLLKEMERVGMILDVTHLSDDSFDEAMDAFGGAVLASHHNCRALVPDQRQLTDEQIKRLIERGAVIGAAMDDWMLIPGWVRGETDALEAGAGLEKVIDHIDHVCQLAGNCRHSAIGSDLDGGFGTEQSPYDLDTIADLRKLPEMLAKRGYSADDIAAILHGNWVRFFETNLPKA